MKKIEIYADVPDDYEWVDPATNQRLGDCPISRIVYFRKKKPGTLWFRAYRYKSVTTGFVEIGTYSTVKTESDKIACVLEAEVSDGFIAWITPWTEYEI